MPANRRYAFDVRQILKHLFDVESFIETRPDMGRAIVTGLARIEGRAVAVLASDCRHLGGAIDGESATKAAALYQLAERWRLPVVTFIDTPGFMVGPDSEAEGAPRLMSDLFIAGATLTQPIVAVFLRRAYGLGAMAMTGGSFEVPRYAISWPQGEFGAMGLEGAVQLGFRQELAEAPDEASRQALFDKLLAEMYEKGRATEAASYLEIDAVIQPEDTRAAIVAALT
jgi:acetyl-CoA carboxylase carboxyltransferase component